MHVSTALEKRNSVQVSEDQSTIDISHSNVVSHEFTAEDDRRVRWKIDCVVLPVWTIEKAVSPFTQANNVSDYVPVGLNGRTRGLF